MGKSYFLALCNDGVPLDDIRHCTLSAAKNAIRTAYVNDYAAEEEGVLYFVEELQDTPTEDPFVVKTAIICDRYYQPYFNSRGTVSLKSL